MEQKTDRLYPTAPVEKDIDLETKITKKEKIIIVLIFQLKTLKK